MRLRLVAGMVGGALSRRNAERSLRSSDALNGAVLASLSARLAVLDRSGRIVRVNQAWHGAATVIGGGKAEVGDNYLDACRAAVGHENVAGDVVRGIERVLAGDGNDEFRTEYGSTPANAWRWDELIVEPLRVPQGGAVVMLTDATARKRAELEAEAHRAEAAHAARGATLGELAAGLAHELNQPLAAILTNVQASQRLLSSEPLRTELLRDIMNDIAADDVRAAEIIRRMRALLKKGQRDVQPLDLSQLAADVLRLVASDAILRRVRVHSQLEPDLPGIVGDRVQLQQVILNLVVNGLESMSEVAPGLRHLTIRTAQPDADRVEVTVQDTGPGISAEILDRIYEPFFSTKPEGLGMGLSICRSIAEAHGGRLEASNNPAGGATFVFALPVAGTVSDTHSPRQEQRSYAEHGTDRLRR
jgi:signal transduction histidine kinase